jgi:hypothetical protein
MRGWVSRAANQPRNRGKIMSLGLAAIALLTFSGLCWVVQPLEKIAKQLKRANDFNEREAANKFPGEKG